MAVRKRIESHIARLEAKGSIVDAFHRQNITAKAVSERWGLDALSVQAERAKKKRAENLLYESWSQVADNTVLVDLSDGTEWVKEAGCLRNLKNNRVMPEQQAAHLFPKLTVKKTEPDLY